MPRKSAFKTDFLGVLNGVEKMTPLSVIFVAALWTLFADGSEISIYGIAGGSVRLLCDIPMSDPPVVEWSDFVYSSDRNPSIIFRTENNPHFEIVSTHQNHQNYIVDQDFALTINLLNLDDDAGSYACRSIVGGNVHARHYYLTVGDSPKCSGNVHLFEGNSTALNCELAYSGRNPSSTWFHNGEEIESIDESEVRLAKKVVSFVAGPDHDQSRYSCRMSFGNVTEECSLVLDVKYLVRDLRWTPVKEKFRAGDELQCSARGNPMPAIALLPLHDKSGPGWKSLSIGHNWEGQRVTMACTASNTVGSVTETQSSNLTVQVSAPRKIHTTTASPVVEKGRTFQHRIRHSSTSPSPHMKKDKDHATPGGHHRRTHNHQHHHSTTTPILNKAQHNMDEFPAGDDKNDQISVPVTHKMTHGKSEPSEAQKVDTKITKATTNSVASAKPAHSKTNHADQVDNNIGLVSTVVFLLFNLILTIY